MTNGEIFDGKYRIIDIIGRGGMSTVYLSENIKLGTLWAIKEIQRKGIKQIDFLAEPNMLKKLNHPALPRIFDIIEEDEKIYIIVDYIEGKNLMVKLQEEGRFAESVVVNWAKQLCEVLLYLHSQYPHPIIYRDMKPSNIIASTNGNISLIDFGIAREYKPESSNDTVYIGTKGYAAPEQYGLGQTNKSTDIYSLGVTLYHLLTGKNPNSPPYDIKPVKSLVPELSDELEKIISKCMQINADDRYQDVEELLQAFNALIECKSLAYCQNEKKLQSNKSLPVNTEYKSFRRLVISVPDNCEFACEFGYSVSRLTNLKILIVDMEHQLNKTDIYLPLINQAVINNNEKGNFTSDFWNKLRNEKAADLFSSVCRKCRGLGNLHILELPFVEESDKGSQVEKIIDFAYRHYDLTLLVINKEDIEQSKLALLHTDIVFAAGAANTDVLRVYENYRDQITEEYGVAFDCFKYIAYEYKDGINTSVSTLKRIFDKGNFLGYLKYYPEREKCRNVRTYFCEEYFSLIKDEYTNFMEAIGISQKKTTKNHLFRNLLLRSK